MSNYKSYKKYKDSGISWLREIPEHWQETDLRMLYSNNKVKNDGLIENNLLSLSYGKLKRKNIDNATGLVPASFENYQVIEPNYIVLRFTDLQNDKKSLRVGFANERGIITSAYIGLAPKIDLHSKYYYYLLHYLDKIKYYYNLGGGVRQSLSYKDFGKETITLPPKSEQTAIANFLDYKIEKINRFITKKKQLIEFLNEKKTAIINEMVTGKKVWNGNTWTEPAKVKDSGIEWLGDIPEHWEVRKLKTIVSKKITDGPHETPNFIDDGVPFLSAEAVNSDGSLNFDNKRADISKEQDLLYSKKCKPQFDDVFIVKSGSTTGKIGYVDTNRDFNIWSPLALIRVKSNVSSGEYIFRSLQSEYFQNQVKTSWSFGTQPNIGMGVLENLYVIIPPKDVQLKIISHIEAETKKIDKTIATIEKEIILVEEYKTALISEAVTGKIDVEF